MSTFINKHKATTNKSTSNRGMETSAGFLEDGVGGFGAGYCGLRASSLVIHS